EIDDTHGCSASSYFVANKFRPRCQAPLALKLTRDGLRGTPGCHAVAGRRAPLRYSPLEASVRPRSLQADPWLWYAAESHARTLRLGAPATAGSSAARCRGTQASQVDGGQRHHPGPEAR